MLLDGKILTSAIGTASRLPSSSKRQRDAHGLCRQNKHDEGIR